jgi:hypothetical protein
MEFGHMIYEKEIDIYLEAKQQSKANKAMTVISILALITFVALRLLDISNAYLDVVVISVFIGALVNANGSSFISHVTRSQLLKIIERQINSDPEAIKYVASKKN